MPSPRADQPCTEIWQMLLGGQDDNGVRLGPPGVGRTDLEVAQGREAVSHGYTVRLATEVELLGSLVKGQQQGNLEMRLAEYSKPKQLVIDELGYLPLDGLAQLFF